MSREPREIFKVDFRAHARQAWHSVFYVSGLFILPLYFQYRFGAESLRFAWTFAGIVFLLAFLPHAALHLRYRSIDKGKQVRFLSRPNRLSIQENGVSTVVPLENIESVEFVVPLAQKSTVWLFPWDSYSYAVVRDKDGHRFLLTSLIVPRLDWPSRLPGAKIRETFYAWPEHVLRHA